MIVELVKNGRRVGITAVSHKVITNLLGEVCRHALEIGVRINAIQKSNDCDGCSEPAVTQAEDNQAVLRDLRRLGSKGFWARAPKSTIATSDLEGCKRSRGRTLDDQGKARSRA